MSACVLLFLMSIYSPAISAEKDENWNIVPFVKYQLIPRPEKVMTRQGMVPFPDDMVAPPGVRLRFINIKTVDDFIVSGALWEPEKKDPQNTVAFVNIHGSGGNYFGDPVAFLTKLLSADGYACLAINTRQHDQYVNTDNFLDVRKDIESAVLVLQNLGYKKIVLHGHSLGTSQSLYYEAVTRDPAVKVLVLTSMFSNLPWKSRFILNQDEEKYKLLNKTSLDYMKTGRGSEVLPIGMGHTDTTSLTGLSRSAGKAVPVTAQHFATYRSTDADIANSTYWIRLVSVPILMIRDEGDAIIRDFEPNWLLSSATAEGSLVPNIKFVLIPNAKGLNPDGHFFRDNKQELFNVMTKWLHEHSL